MLNLSKATQMEELRKDTQGISDFPGEIIQDIRITRSKAKKLAPISPIYVAND